MLVLVAVRVRLVRRAVGIPETDGNMMSLEVKEPRTYTPLKTKMTMENPSF